MRQQGFSLVEMLVVMAIVGVLIAVATLNYSSMQQKAAVEGQVKVMLADITNVRVQALYTKNPRSIKFDGNKLYIYPSDDTSVTPESQISYAYSVTTNFTDNTITFTTSGLTATFGGSICIDPAGDMAKENAGSVDSLIVSRVRVNMGKRHKGAACDTGNIDQQ